MCPKAFNCSIADMPEVVTINRTKYTITNPSDLIQRALVNKVQWNSQIVDLIETLINSQLLNHFVNVGAHIGTVCMPVSNYVEKVTAIEAYPPTYKQLVDNIALNSITNITCHNVAIGAKEDTVYFMSEAHERVQNNTGGMHVFTESDLRENRRSANLCDKKVSCHMKRFDDMKIDPFDIMLVDIEGMEYDFLQGARESILRCKPVLIIEIWDDAKRKAENMPTKQDEIVKYILAMNYKLFTNIGDDFVFFPL